MKCKIKGKKKEKKNLNEKFLEKNENSKGLVSKLYWAFQNLKIVVKILG
jgi:hypothetical protein